MLQSSIAIAVRRVLFVGAAGLMWVAASSFAQGGMGAQMVDENGNSPCANNPQSEVCIASQQPPRQPPALTDSCIADPASCNLTQEMVDGILACQADAQSDVCVAFREAQPKPQRPPLPDNCMSDPASCGLSAEELAGIQACQTDEASDACVAFRATKGKPEACSTDPSSEECQKRVGKHPQPNCDTQPERCAHPGPAIFDIDTQTLYVQAVRFRQNGELLPRFYGVELTIDASGLITLTDVQQLINQGNTNSAQ